MKKFKYDLTDEEDIEKLFLIQLRSLALYL